MDFILCDCMAQRHDQVISLLVDLNVITVNGATTQKGTITAKTKQNMIHWFSDSSPLNNTCDECKNKTINEKDDENVEMNKLKQQINELKSALDEKNKLIQQLTDENDNPNEIIAFGDGSAKNSVTTNESNVILQKFAMQMNNIISKEMNTLADKLAEECNKAKNQIETSLNVSCASGSSEMDKTSNAFRRKSGGFIQSNVVDDDGRFDEVEQSDKTQQKTSNTKVTFNGNLQPPIQKDKRLNKYNLGAYAIHVSKFDMKTTEDDIDEHILKNTDIISKELFQVQILNSKKADYNSFKITSLSHDIYRKIMDIWAPHFVAREFNETPFKSASINKTPMIRPNNRVSFGKHQEEPNRFERVREKNGHTYEKNIVQT